MQNHNLDALTFVRAKNTNGRCSEFHIRKYEKSKTSTIWKTDIDCNHVDPSDFGR